MPDTTPSGLHPAYPTREQLLEEMDVELLECQQIGAAARLRLIISSAIAQVQDIDFPLGSPTKGYDPPDIIATLRDLMPDIKDMTPVWRDAARDRVREVV